jgi:uncharacterized membrane protein YgcG
MLAWSHTRVLVLQLLGMVLLLLVLVLLLVLLLVVVVVLLLLLKPAIEALVLVVLTGGVKREGLVLRAAAVVLTTLQYSPVPWSNSTTGLPGLTGAAGLAGLTGMYCEQAVLPLVLDMTSGCVGSAGVMRQPVNGLVVSLRLTGVEGGSGMGTGGGGDGGWGGGDGGGGGTAAWACEVAGVTCVALLPHADSSAHVWQPAAHDIDSLLHGCQQCMLQHYGYWAWQGY